MSHMDPSGRGAVYKCSFAVGALLLCVVGMWCLGSCSKPAARTTANAWIVLHLKGDSPLAQQHPRAEVIQDLSSLPPAPSGCDLVAAGRFEPSGLQIPEGLPVTWTLPSPRTPGSTLTIAYCNEAEKTWLPSAQMAQVSASGGEATGVVYHFSQIGLMRGSRSRYDYRLGEIIEYPGQEQAAKIYAIYVKKNMSDIASLTRDLLKVAGDEKGRGKEAFEKLKELIEHGMDLKDKDGKPAFVQIHETDSKAMAKQRDAWIKDTWDKVIADQATQGKEIRIVTSDSGNEDSGIASDLDQTVYVLEKNKDGVFVRNGDLDKTIAEAFEAKWGSAKDRPSLEALEICTIAGKDRFPDPREVRMVNYFETFRTTMENLRKTPGAYTYPGAVGQQMQMRALSKIFKAREKGEAHPRVFRMFGQGELPAFDADFAIRTMFGPQPDLLPGYAFGAAMANFLELQKYMDPALYAKYQLRGWEDTLVSLHVASEGLTKDAKVEYADLSRQERLARCDTYLNEMFAGLPEAERAAKIKTHKVALEISRNLRLLHKNQAQRIELADGQGVPGGADARQAIFRELGVQLLGAEYKGSAEDLEKCYAEHKRLANEFCLESVMHTSQEAVQFLKTFKTGPIDLLDLKGYQHLLSDIKPEDWDKFRSNMHDGLSLTLYYSFYDLAKFGKDGELADRVKQKFPEMAKEVDRMRGAARDASQLETMIRDFREPFARRSSGLRQAFCQSARELLWTDLPALNLRVQQHIATQIGLKDAECARLIGGFLDTKYLSWNLKGRVKDTALDPGNISALLEIIRVAHESNFDPYAIGAAAVKELFFMFPLVGQAAPIVTLDGVGTVMALTPLTEVLGGKKYEVVAKVAGKAVFWLGVGQATFALIDQQYLTPHYDNTVDAIYRGFIGPPTQNFDKPPAQFTDADASRLVDLRARVAAARKDYEDGLAAFRWASARAPISGEAYRLAKASLDQRKAEADRIKSELEPEIDTLEKKRDAFDRYSKGPWYGGSVNDWSLVPTLIEGLGWRPPAIGAQERQRPFKKHYLLDAIPLVVFYSPDGYVDFRLTWTADDQKALEDTQRAIINPGSVDAMLEAAAKHQELLSRKIQYYRMQRYRNLATGQPIDWSVHKIDDWLTPEQKRQLDKNFPERKEGNQELLHQIQRDSLWPGMVELSARDMRRYGSVKNFVETWWQAHAFPGALAMQDILHRSLEQAGLSVNPASWLTLKDTLENRMQKDWVRSEGLHQEYKRWLTVEKKRREAQARLRVAAYYNSAGSAAIKALRDHPAFKKDVDEMLLAIRLAAVKRHAPKVDATVFMKRVPKKEQSKPEPKSVAPRGIEPAKPGGPEYEFRVSYTVKTDPAIYFPPYKADLQILTKPLAQDAIKEKAIKRAEGGPLPVTEATVKLLEEALEKAKNGGVPDDELIIPLITVFASGAADMSKMAFPNTVAGLPGMTQVAPARPGSGGARLSPADGPRAAWASWIDPPVAPWRSRIAAVLQGRGILETAALGMVLPSDAGQRSTPVMIGQNVIYGRLPVVKEGPVRLETRREGSEDTLLVVTTDSLSQFDEHCKANRGDDCLYYRLFWSHSADGPFKPVPLSGREGDWGYRLLPRSGGKDDFEVRRLSKDQVGLRFSEAKPNWKRTDRNLGKPVCFQVSEQWCNRARYVDDWKPVGEERFSNVAEPGPMRIEVFPSVGWKETGPDQYQQQLAFGGKASLDFCVTLENQGFRFQGAHATVQSDVWTRHCWMSRRSDGTHSYGASEEGGMGPKCAVHCAIPLSGLSLTISAEAGEFQGTRKVSLLPKNDASTSGRDEWTRNKRSAEQSLNDLKEKAGKLRRELAEAQSDLAKMPERWKNNPEAMAKWDYASVCARLNADIASKKGELALLEQVEIARKMLWIEQCDDRKEGTFGDRQALARALRELELEELEYKLWLQRVTACWNIEDRLFSRSDAPQLQRETYLENKEKIRGKKGAKEERERRLLGGRGKCWAKIAEAALDAGDAGLMEQAYLNQIRYQLDLSQGPENKLGLLDPMRSVRLAFRSLAAGAAELSADRRKAADYWIKGYEIEKGDGRKQEEARKQRGETVSKDVWDFVTRRWDEEKDLPAWWPEEQVEAKADDRPLQEQVNSLLERQKPRTAVGQSAQREAAARESSQSVVGGNMSSSSGRQDSTSSPGVPAVVGMSAQEAKAAIERAGLRAKFRLGRPANSRAETYRVYEVATPPGATVAPGTEIELTVYAPPEPSGAHDDAGGRRMRVPDVLGMSAKEAKAALEAAGLEVELLLGEPAPTAGKALTVYATDPEAKAPLPDTKRIKVKIYGPQ